MHHLAFVILSEAKIYLVVIAGVVSKAKEISG